MKNITSATIILLSILTLTACKKTQEQYSSAIEDDSFAAATFDDVKNIVDEAATKGSVSQYKTTSGLQNHELLAVCANVTIDTLAIPRTVTVDFGSTNCTCQDGRNRRGKIISTFTGRYRDAGTVITHTFENYFVDDNQVSGTKTVTNTGNYVFTVVVDGTIERANNEGTITWNSNRVRTWSEGYNTPLLLADDVYQITGSASGNNAQGDNFSITITQPLVRKLTLGCARNFIEGELQIELDNKPLRTLNYGDGTCDNEGTLTIDNRTYTINLR